MRPSGTKLVLAAATFVLAAALPGPAGAKTYPYCAWYSDGSTNCGFPTMWSCQASVSGVGGYCGVNPRAAWGARNRKPAPYDSGWAPPRWQ